MRWGFGIGFCKLRGRGCGVGPLMVGDGGGEAFAIKHEVTEVRVGEADWRCECGLPNPIINTSSPISQSKPTPPQKR